MEILLFLDVGSLLETQDSRPTYESLGVADYDDD